MPTATHGDELVGMLSAEIQKLTATKLSALDGRLDELAAKLRLHMEKGARMPGLIGGPEQPESHGQRFIASEQFKAFRV